MSQVKEQGGSVTTDLKKQTRGAQMTHHEPLVEELEFSKSAHCSLMLLIPKKT